MSSCVFCRIVAKEIPATIEYEDEDVVAFKDIHPLAPVHILVIPQEHIREFVSVTDDKTYVAIMHALAIVIKEKGLDAKGYKIEVNGGGAQLVDHLHFHLLGPVGKPAV